MRNWKFSLIAILTVAALAYTIEAGAAVTPASTADMLNLVAESTSGSVASFKRQMPDGTKVAFTIPQGQKLVLKTLNAAFIMTGAGAGPESVYRGLKMQMPFWTQGFRLNYWTYTVNASRTFYGMFYFATAFADGLVITSDGLLNAKIIDLTTKQVVPGSLRVQLVGFLTTQ